MAFKLEIQHRHILKLVARDSDADGYTIVSKILFSVLSENMPKELVIFEETSTGYRAKLTEEGKMVVKAMEWL